MKRQKLTRTLAGLAFASAIFLCGSGFVQFAWIASFNTPHKTTAVRYAEVYGVAFVVLVAFALGLGIRWLVRWSRRDPAFSGRKME